MVALQAYHYKGWTPLRGTGGDLQHFIFTFCKKNLDVYLSIFK